MSGTKISSTAPGSNSAQKAPIFSIKKAGFFIPKNKLAGSLVPVLRGAKKPGLSDAFGSAETTKRVLRKTKWGPDLTQDPTVRKARALAYQTRVDQITRQLKSGMTKIRDPGDTELASQSPDHESSMREIDSERSERLEVEKREAIGEIVKLNPSFKAPPDYKPLLKEDQVSIPVKQYPGYNFVGLIYGPGGDNQKHLEKETGAKIKMFGTKVESGNKIEIKQSDTNDVHDAYEEIHIHISADTFDKVDAAISVIELLITSVSENLAAASTTSTSTAANDSRVPLGPDAANLNPVHSSTMQPMPDHTQTFPQGQLGYPNPWFPPGPPIPPNNPSHVPNLPFTAPSNVPLQFGSASIPTVGFNLNSHPQNTQPPPQVLSHPYTPQPNPVTVGPPMGLSRPPMIQSLPQPASSLPLGTVVPVSTGFGNVTQMAPRMAPNHGLHPASSPAMPSTPTLLVNASTIGHPHTPSMLAPSTSNFNPQTPQLQTAPSSGNFPYQHLGPHNPVSQMVPRPHSNQLSAQNSMPANPMLQSPSPRPPPSQLPMPNFAPQPFNHGFPRLPMGQPQPHISLAPAPFVRRLPSPSGLPAFPDAPRNYGPTSQVPVFLGPRSHPQMSQYNNNNLSFASGRPLSNPGEQQLYDPFSPTSMSMIRRR